jgi:hypothetical protein
LVCRGSFLPRNIELTGLIGIKDKSSNREVGQTKSNQTFLSFRVSTSSQLVTFNQTEVGKQIAAAFMNFDFTFRHAMFSSFSVSWDNTICIIRQRRLGGNDGRCNGKDASAV